MLVLTIFVLTILFIFSWLVFDRDIMAPPTVVTLGFLFSCMCAFYNEKTWGLEFSIETTGIIVVGILTTIAGGILGVFLSRFPYVRKLGFSHERTEARVISVDAAKTIAVIIFEVVTMVLVYLHIRQVTGFSAWIPAVGAYRMLTQGQGADLNDLSLSVPWLTRNMIDVSFVIDLIYSYIVGNNLIARKKFEILNWIPVFLYVVLAFMQGGRREALRLWIAILIVAYTTKKRSVGWKNNRKTRKMIKTMAFSVLAVGAVFYIVRNIVGRDDHTMDPLYYVTFYAGCPIAGLDQYLKRPLVRSKIWGKETFFDLNRTFLFFFGKPERYLPHKPFIQSPTGVWIGNVYTMFWAPYVDFGFWGMVFVLFVFGTFFTFLYCKVRKKRGTNPIDFTLLFYSYVAFSFFMYFYSVYTFFISHLIIKYCVELLVIRWALVGWHFKRPKYYEVIKEPRSIGS